MNKKLRHIILFKSSKTKRFAFLFIVLAVASFCYAQTLPRDDYFNSEQDTRQFNQNKWGEIKDGLSYSNFESKDDDETLTDQQQANRSSTNHSESNERNIRRFSGDPSPFWLMFFKVLAILMLIGLVAIILVNVLGGGNLFVPKSRKIKETNEVVTLEDIEANIHESDLDRHIREAIEQKNYTLAIRLYYLAIIKELSLNRWIKWKRDKTNKDYLREMRNTNLFKPYREVTRIFERAWYGQSDLGEQDFQRMKPQFVDMINQAKRTTD